MNLKRVKGIAGRPESLLAAGVVGLLGAVCVLVSLSMAACEQWEQMTGSGGGKRDAAGGGSVVAKSGPAQARSGGRLSETTTEPEMRVRLLGGVEGVRLAGGGGLRVSSGEPGESPGRVVPGAASVSLAGGEWVVSGAGGAWTRLSAARPVSVEATGGSALSVDGTPFLGRVRLSARTDVSERAFDVVEFVGIEDYLPGVVAKEMLAGWPAEAYRVQAVCARTYALQERQRSIAAGEVFDVESSDRDQVYVGATSNPAVRQAVAATRGIVLSHEGEFLRAYFSSTCGGRTASARDTWPTGKGWEFNLAAPIQAAHREHACQRSPLYTWTVERDRGELVRRLRAFGESRQLMVRRIRDLHSIVPMSVNEDGRPNRFKVIEPGGTWYQLSGEELRLACNFRVGAGQGTGRPTAGSGGAVMGAAAGGGVGAEPGLADVDRATRVSSSDLAVTVRGDRVTITGRGFGHGVGMCQYCAKGMADRGEDWRAMVARFYPGALVVKAYE